MKQWNAPSHLEMREIVPKGAPPLARGNERGNGEYSSGLWQREAAV